MRKWRSESALDLYNVILAILLFASPWMFSLTNGTARVDFWICSAAVVAISLGAIFGPISCSDSGSSPRPGSSDSRKPVRCISPSALAR